MSEDKQVMDMVNEHAERVKMEEMALNADHIRAAELMGEEYIASRVEKRTVREDGPCNDRAVRRLLVTVIKALVWVLLGLVVLALALGGHGVVVAAACVCLCGAAAAVQIDRHFRRR